MSRGARMSAATGAGRGKKGFHVESQRAAGPADSLVSDFSLQDRESMFPLFSALVCSAVLQQHPTLMQSGFRSKLYRVTSCVTSGDSLKLSELQSPGQKKMRRNISLTGGYGGETRCRMGTWQVVGCFRLFRQRLSTGPAGLGQEREMGH